MAISMHHSNFFRQYKDKFSQKMHSNFFWDFMAYAVTFFMGVGLFLDLKWLVEFNIVVRPMVLIFAVWQAIGYLSTTKEYNK